MKTNTIELKRGKEGQPLFPLHDYDSKTVLKELEQEIVGQAAARAKAHISGGLLFRLKVRKALKTIHQKSDLGPGRVPVKFFISSNRIKLDSDLGILYLNPTLSSAHMAEIIKEIYTKGTIEQKYEKRKNALADFFGYLNRKIARISIERKLEKTAVAIIKSPPLGKIATEDQHFLMMIVRLEMFIKKIAQKIEKRSVISLLQKERIRTQKMLTDVQRRHKDDFNTEKTVRICTKINLLDSVIHNKRLLVQERLFDRALLGIKNWHLSPDRNDQFIKNESRLLKGNTLIGQLERKKRNLKKDNGFSFSSFLRCQTQRKLMELKRKMIQYKYLVSVYDKQKDFSEKLKNLFMKKQGSELIPPGYNKSLKAKLFDLIRLFLNLIFVGFYIYLIDVPLPFLPVFLLLGLFVFQPIANKFAVLFMSFFAKNSGAKRLSMFELKKEIARKAKNGQYLCAIDLPIYTGKPKELETTLHYITKNLNNLKDTLCFFDRLAIVYQVTSNTSEKGLIGREIEIVRRVQKYAERTLGKNRVYFLYLHRSASVAKKVGNIVAAHLFKYHGFTYPEIYTNTEKFILTFDKKPLFDRAYGEFRKSLCQGSQKDAKCTDNRRIISEILNGERIKIKNRIDFAFFVDNKNEIKKGSLEKALAIMMHPENKNIGILQPEMSIEDPISQGNKVTSAFLRMMRIARDVHNVRYLNTLHGLYNNMSAYYGKGMLRLKTYDYMVINEVLNLQYVDSHDWQESVFNHAVLAVSGEKKVSAFKKKEGQNQFHILIEKRDRSALYSLDFYADKCSITDENKNIRTISVSKDLSVEEAIKQATGYIDNGVEVGERELISTIGNYTRDARWLKGDLQMFNTFMPYASFLPPYHQFHLENIFRRFTNELALSAWVFINFLFALIAPSAGLLPQEIFVTLTLYLAVTAFGFAGIDLFLYPIFFESDNRIRFESYSKIKSLARLLLIILKKIFTGLWQFLIYILIAWPRVFLGIKTSLKVLFTSMDRPLNWGSVSNTSISVEETNGRGIPLSKFFRFYGDGIIMGAGLGILLAMLVISGQAFMSIIMPFNMGIIVLSFLAGPLTSYLISKKIRVK